MITNKYSFKGKIKDIPTSKLIITETGHRPTQYKKIVDILSVLCADKNYQGIDDVIWTGNDLVETDFMPTYPDADQWFSTHYVKIETVNPNDQPDPNTGLHPRTVTMARQTHVFDTNLQKELLLEFKWDFKIDSEEYSKFLANKKDLITIIFV